METPEVFYPELPEEGTKEAQVLINKFINDLKKSANDAIDKLYCATLPHIESDSWSNFRNDIMSGYKDYKNKIHREYDFKDIRQKIFEEHREEIIKDLNQDLVKENEDLKKTIRHLQELRSKTF